MNTGQKSGWAGLEVETRWPNEVHRTERGRPRLGGAEAIQAAIETVRQSGSRATVRAVKAALREAGAGATNAEIRVAVREAKNGPKILFIEIT